MSTSSTDPEAVVEPATSPAEEREPPVLVRATDLGLTVGHSRVWHDLTFSLGAGLSVVHGVSGSGKSSLLLALTGRMSGLTGQLTVADLDAVRQTRRLRAITSVARISSMIDLESQLTVAESATERALIDGVPTSRAAVRIRELEDVVDHHFPRDRLIADLDAFDQTLLAACLAGLRPARLIVLDDADRGLAVTDQRQLLQALQALAGSGVSIVVSTRESTVIPAGSPHLHLSDPHRSGTDPAAAPDPPAASASRPAPEST